MQTIKELKENKKYTDTYNDNFCNEVNNIEDNEFYVDLISKGREHLLKLDEEDKY